MITKNTRHGQLYTIGYQALPPARLLQIAQALDATVIDVRKTPVSRIKGYHKMTPAELKTLREACGLSLPKLAAICGVQERTARYWESGKTTVPADVQARVYHLDAQLTLIAQQAINTVAEVIQRQGSAPAYITLLRYRTDADLDHFHPSPTLATCHTGTHAAMLYRIYNTLQRQSIPCRIVYMEPEAYQNWLIATQQTDTEATRSAWAALQPLA
jgi:DNA-binding transcriptional regulator YiaG